MTHTSSKKEELFGDDTVSKIIEDIWFAARRGEADMRPYEERINSQLTQALKELKEEVIGEDIDEDNYGWKNWKGTTAKAINIILEEQRKAIDEKIKELEG